MYIENVRDLTRDSYNERQLYDEIMMIEDTLTKQITSNSVRERAKELGVVKQFDDTLKAAEKEYKRRMKIEIANSNSFTGANSTDFTEEGDTVVEYRCGDWVADDEGIRLHTDKGLLIVCPHPIYVTKILKNADTGKYKAELTFIVRNRIKRIYVNREVLASASKIVSLADDGVQITNLTAPLLVKYLSDLEALNPDKIKEELSTSRLGWIDMMDAGGVKVKQFLPHMSKITFDNETNYKSLVESIKPTGSRDEWYKLVKEIRQKRQPEVLINLAASFASVLVEPCGILPFIVSLWGGTGIGKSVILKLCTSVWADPTEGRYITDPKATYTAMEMRLNVLNSLPMTIDDMAQVNNQYDRGFDDLIYRWCSGKGRERSNKELGLNKLTSWRNCTITNGERSLVDESTQGGAINRVIDIESSGDVLFDGKSGNKTVNIIEKNYGWAGEEWVLYLFEIGFEAIAHEYAIQYDRIKEAAERQGVEKEDKQISPMAVILAADVMTERELFNDGITIPIDTALKYLRNKGDVSEDLRAYEYLLNTIAENSMHFDSNADEHTSSWGFKKDDDTIVINGSRFDEIIKEGGFQSKAFLTWCKRAGIVETDPKGSPKKVVKHKGNCYRAVIIKTNYNLGENDENADEMDVLAMNLPFK